VSQIRTLPIADRDIEREAINIADYGGVEASLRFYEACDRAFLLLSTQPRMGIAQDFGNPILAGMRMWRLKGFEEYLIFYRPIQGGIEVMRVVNGSRDLPIVFAAFAEKLAEE
jgi:toxin ParE1/3/4